MYHTGTYLSADSPLHRLDPRIKLAGVVGLSIIILMLGALPLLFVCLALLALICQSGIKMRTIGQALQPLLFFIVLIFLVHTFLAKGENLPGTSGLALSFSWGGLQEGVFVSLRFVCLVVAAVLLTLTTPPSQMIAALKFFLQPLKKLRLPVDNMIFMIMLALRLLPVLLGEKERIETARKARGYNIRQFSYSARIKAFLTFVTRILWNVFQRADELSAAMIARNYQAGPRTSFVTLKPIDAKFIILLALIFCLVFFVALISFFG